MEITLNDNSKILFEWTKSGALYAQLLKPGFLHDGHGYLLTASAILDGADLDNFLREIRTQAEDEAA